MPLDDDDRRLLRYLTAQRDDELSRSQGRRARRKFNQGIGNTPWTPVQMRSERTWNDPTGDRAASRADRTRRTGRRP